MSLLPRRAAHKEESELTVYTRLLQIIFLEGNEAREETLTLLFLSHRMENKPHCKHPETSICCAGKGPLQHCWCPRPLIYLI